MKWFRSRDLIFLKEILIFFPNWQASQILSFRKSIFGSPLTKSFFKIFCKNVQNEKGYFITCIRSDHGGEFENHAFENFCNDFAIEPQFSSLSTPQQNGVVGDEN